MSFKNTKDEPRAVSVLRQAIERSQLAHALVFAGPKGSGGREAAFWLARALFCPARQGGEPCGTCLDCRQVNERVHPDFFLLEPGEDSKGIRVEAVRGAIARSNLRPFRANHKVFVVDPADEMNDTAQNALLKTLEEPPAGTFFILIASSPEKLLVTIRSRAQTFHFPPNARGAEPDEETEALARAVLDFARGASREAPDLSKLPRETIAGLIDRLIGYFRGLLLVSAGAPELAGEGFQDEAPRADHWERRIEVLSELKEKILGNIHLKLALGALWDYLETPDA
ncbi:MAG: DNA polymerase III subunit delta' [Candidatus Omnitrophica bacterium]|nr:DNA polymerase III subunit delta' [Candidatus Omnitrophota bacterium]